MNDRELRRLDLGLLLVFAETMRHRRLTIVAERLGQTQSAISHALARLRDIVGEPLFVRRPNGVEPTARALALEPAVNDIIDMARAALSQTASFDPATATGEVRVAAQDYHCALFAAPLVATLEKEAPAMHAGFLPLARSGALEALENGRADLAIGFIPKAGERFISEPLVEQDYAVVARKGHAAAARLNELDVYVAQRHLLVSQSGDRTGTVDHALAQVGRSREVVSTVPYYLAALAAVAVSDLVVTVPRLLAERYAGDFGLLVTAPPVKIRRFTLSLLRHRRNVDNPMIDWVAAILKRQAD